MFVDDTSPLGELAPSCLFHPPVRPEEHGGRDGQALRAFDVEPHAPFLDAQILTSKDEVIRGPPNSNEIVANSHGGGQVPARASGANLRSARTPWGVSPRNA